MNYAHAFLPNKINKDFLIYQTFSFILAKKSKIKINLYSNLEYIETCKKIGLNYDNFFIIEKDKRYNNYWSYPKMEVLKINNDIIIDHDLFLFKDISNYRLDYDIIYSHQEFIKDNKWYRGDLVDFFASSIPKNKINEWDFLIETLYDKDFNIEDIYSHSAFNCSILGFRDKNIAKDYAEKSLLLFEFFNNKNFNIKNIRNSIYLPTIAEQLFLSFYAKYHNLNAYDLHSKNKNNLQYSHLGNKKNINDDYSKKIFIFLKNNHPNIYENLLKYIV